MDFKSEIGEECGFHIEKTDDFCSPEEVVDKLKEEFIDKDFRKIFSKNDKNNKDKPLELLKDKFNCDTEVCILEQPEVKKVIGSDTVSELIVDRFKITGPRESEAWFSNIEIDGVLDQIQKKYIDRHFLHLPFQMIDFEKTDTALARLDWPAEYEKGYRCFGVVLNTDTSKGRGEHWFSIFGDFSDGAKEFTIEYFNSSGELPMNEVATWMKKVKHKWQPYFQNIAKIKDVCATRIINQKDGFSCGAYSLYYIISRLDGIPYQWFAKNAIGDNNMVEFRKYLFRPT
jgi:hypothetical protein